MSEPAPSYVGYQSPQIIKPCPFCGGPAKVYGSNMVACENGNICGGAMDFGHWVGTLPDGRDAVEAVIEAWNRRAELPKSLITPEPSNE